jgi:DNA-binding HxlR family transcriptional regulator
MVFLTRTGDQEKPPRVKYALTKKGQRALSVIDRLIQYGEELISEVDLRILAHLETVKK